jgi:ankyrin repeat protein
MESRKTDIKSNHAKTCQWLLDHPGYQDWLDPARLAQHYGFLWISGKPGAGKSTIMKFAYSSMKKARRADAKTASFFFNARGGYLEKSTSGLYRSLLLQLLEGYRDLQIVLDDPDILPQNQEGCPSLTILKDLFRNAISALGKRQFTCFVDALDECDEQQVMDMVEFFEDLGEQATDKGISFRVCFSSRHYPYIVPKRGIRLKLEDQPGHAADLATYITNRLRINDSFLIEELRPELLKKAAGVFMWVVLVVQILNEEDRQGGLALRKRIAEIPSDLSKLFKDILTRDNTKMNSLLLCIRWILFAERPLQPEEFRHALWSGLSLKNMADTQIPASIHSGNRDSLDKIVISSSKGLAEISRSKLPTVQFIHESVRDFLIKDNGLHELWPGLETDWKSSSHEELKKCCNFYLKQPSISSYIQDSTPSNPNMQEEILNKFPFSKYATQNILYHANAAAEMVSQSEFLSDFPISSWIKMNNSFEKHRIREYTSTASLIYILADRGYSYLVRTRLQEDSQVHILGERYRYPLFAAWANGNKDTIAALLNSTSTVENGAEIPEGLKYRNDLKDYKNRTPLTWAAQDGRLGILRLLLKAELTIDEADGKGRTGLSRASENGHETVAKLLIDHGADVNANDQSGWTPLIYASKNSHEAVVKLLIDSGANVNIEHPLMFASENGYEAVVKLLIDNGANVNTNDQSGCTPLMYALLNGHEAVARLLIDNGANVNANSQSGWTPLIFASKNGHKAMARLLINNGANVNANDQSRWTPFTHALLNGHEAVVKLLIDSGANVDIKYPIIHASKNGYEAVARLLIDNGADVNANDQNGCTPLIYASLNGHEVVARLLIDNGANVNANSQSGWTPLTRASLTGREAVARVLIDNGADVNANDQSGWTPLIYSSLKGHEAVARLLIENGANVNGIDQIRWTPLIHASLNGHEAMARLLIDNGADINASDQLGWTPLIHASFNGHEAMARLLIENGANVNANDQSRWTALIHASFFGHEAVVQLLIDNRADINASDQLGWTPLIHASFNGHEAVARLLIDNGASMNASD